MEEERERKRGGRSGVLFIPAEPAMMAGAISYLGLRPYTMGNANERY